MKKIPYLIPALLVMMLAGGCIVTGSARVHTRAHARPAMVYVSPGVYVIEDYHEPVFYSDGYYWRYYGNVWYRSSYHTGGWVVYHNVPRHVRRIDRPHTYVRYRGEGRARVRDHRGGGRTHVRGHDSGGGGVRVRDHRGSGGNNNGRGTVRSRDHRGNDNGNNNGGGVRTRDHRGKGDNNNNNNKGKGGVRKRDHR
jgi:hypothetical protein